VVWCNDAQVPFSASIKAAHPNTAVGAVGLIPTAEQAERILQEKKAGVIILGREIVRTPSFVFRAAEEFGVVVRTTVSGERSWLRMTHPKVHST
jgi:2,4-dienoyl-CoA reductase-like NADH-dependent reductase (Old Yellow Enzyme family)